MPLHRVRGLAQRLGLKVIELLLPLVYEYPLLVDPRSFSNAAKELDVILPVTCRATGSLTGTNPEVVREGGSSGESSFSYLWC